MDKEILELQKRLQEQKLVEQEISNIHINKETLPVEAGNKQLVEQKNENEEEEQPTTTNDSNLSSLISNEINQQYSDVKDKVFKNDSVKEIITQITERETKSQLEKDMLKILSTEQMNALAKYTLDCEKEKLDYRKRKEKNLVKEQVKAEVFKKKVEVLKNKYGYLYKKDDNGNLLNFIPSKSYNRYKAFCNWWEGTTDGFKRIVKGTLKVLFWVALVGVIGLVGYKLVMWISSLNIPKVG